MPPRIQQRVSNSLLPYLSSPSSSRIPLSSSCSSSNTSQSSRSFTSTPASQTQQRAAMFQWLNTEGAAFKNHTPGSTHYLTDAVLSKSNPDHGYSGRPFPLNPTFHSESILSEELRNEIYQRVMVKKRSVRTVSYEMGVDMRRVAAVCRLGEMEKRMRQQVGSYLFYSSSTLLLFIFHVAMMRQQKNRLVFTTSVFWECVQRLYPDCRNTAMLDFARN